MKRVNSRNDLWSWWQHYRYRPGIIIIILLLWASEVCLSVAYIGPKSRTERPRKSKIGKDVAHITSDSYTTFEIKRVKVIGGGTYCDDLPHSLLLLLLLIDFLTAGHITDRRMHWDYVTRSGAALPAIEKCQLDSDWRCFWRSNSFEFVFVRRAGFATDDVDGSVRGLRRAVCHFPISIQSASETAWLLA